ncbi:MAG: leucine-rich repeat domain-containing protein [Pirellulales bacterium]
MFIYSSTNYRIGVTVFVVLTALACLCIVRTVKRWKKVGTWRRVYGAVTVGLSLAIPVALIIQVAHDEMFAPGYLRAIWKIERLGGSVQVDEARSGDVYVSLDGPLVTDADLKCLEAFPRLRSLKVFGSQVTDAGLEHIQGMTNLRFLHLAFTSVTDDGLDHLRGLTGLAELNLSDTKITDAGLAHLKALTELRQLYLQDTQITDTGLAQLRTLTKLEYLDVQSTRVTKLGEEKFQQALPKCKIVR